MNNIETWFTIDGYIGTTLTKVDPTVNNIQKNNKLSYNNS